MEVVLMLLAAIAPVAVLLWYIFKKDRVQPEPPKWLSMAFFYGFLSILVSLGFSSMIEIASGLNADVEAVGSVVEAFANAFCLAAIPEEVAKFVMLVLLVKFNPYFDEKFDGIVYAVCVGMGFACFENILYLAQAMENGAWVTTGITRALFSVPGHFLFAVLMGYYYSLYHFGIDRGLKTKLLVLGAPILAHGLFDGILFSVSADESLAVICLFLFLYFFNKLRKLGKARIFRLMNQ